MLRHNSICARDTSRCFQQSAPCGTEARHREKLDPCRQQGVSVYREQERAFSTGDRVQLAAAVLEMKLANRELGTVERIAELTMGAIQYFVQD